MIHLGSFVTFKQAQEAGGSVRKGEHGTKVYYWKQLVVKDKNAPVGAEDSEKLIPMMREYTVFNVAQCDGLPEKIVNGKPMRTRNPDTRDDLADAFLICSGATEKNYRHVCHIECLGLLCSTSFFAYGG